MTGAKICGLSTPDAVAAALEGGADYLGFVSFARSPRHLPLELAAVLADPARGRARIVVLMVDPDDEAVDEAVRVLRPDLVQLHGRETPARVAEVRSRSGVGVIKALPIATREDFAVADAYVGVADHLMFDARPPASANRPGGHGGRFDWTLLTGHRLERPWFLAGGLDPENVAEAVRTTGAPVVDVSSGVERAPGVKYPALITAFLDAVRRT